MELTEFRAGNFDGDPKFRFDSENAFHARNSPRAQVAVELEKPDSHAIAVIRGATSSAFARELKALMRKRMIRFTASGFPSAKTFTRRPISGKR